MGIFTKRSDRQSSQADYNQMGNRLNIADDEKEEEYALKQRWGYLSISFSVVQTLVLMTMIYSNGVAPLNENPMIGPSTDTLDAWGAKNARLIVDDGEWWRLITPVFLHGGIIHLLCNVGVQLEVGTLFEREWGSLVWLVVFVLSEVGGSILSVIFLPDYIGVGSSSAVMGLFGAKLSEIMCLAGEKRGTAQERIGHDVRMEQLGGVLCSVAMVGLFSFVPLVDWAAHLGGLLAGFATGTVCFADMIGSRLWYLVGIITTTIFFVVSLVYMYGEG